mgnify:CR=1 FL=1
MTRDTDKNHNKKSPDPHNEASPHATGEGCNPDETPVAPSSAAESRTRDEDGCTVKRPASAPHPKTASKDDRENAIGWRSANTEV